MKQENELIKQYKSFPFKEKVMIKTLVRTSKKNAKKLKKGIEKEVSEKKRVKYRDIAIKSIYSMNDVFNIVIDHKDNTLLTDVRQLEVLTDEQLVGLFTEIVEELEEL